MFCAVHTEKQRDCGFADSLGLQCTYCKCYQAGDFGPAYPVPAISYVAVIHVEGSYIWRTTLNGYILERECM